MSDLRQTLDQLDAAHRACASAGPWVRERIHMKRQPDGWHQEVLDDAGTVALLSSDSDGEAVDGGTSIERADLIVAAVNHLPRLTAAVRAVLDLADELDRQAASYVLSAPGSHDDGMRKAFADDAARIRAALSGADTGTTA